MNLTFICLWTWFFSPTSFLSALSLPPSLVSFHLLLCAHLSLKILPCGWFPRMKSLLCKCRSRVWILGTHMKGRPETENLGGRHRRSLRWSDCLHPPKSVNFEFSRRPHPNNEVQSTRERHHTSTADLQCICTCTHVSMHVCMHSTQACKDTDKTHIQRDKYCPFFLWYHTGVLVYKHLLF